MTSKFSQAVEKSTSNKTYGGNGMKAKKSSLNALVDLYGSMGALRGRYEEFSKYFKLAMAQDAVKTMQLLFMLRNVRGGMGERDLFRQALLDLELTHPQLVISVLPLVTKYGRWDDLFIFTTTDVQKHVVRLVKDGLENDETKGLVAKWLPRKAKNDNERAFMSRLRSYLKLTPKAYRQTIATLSKEANVVEQKMCAKEWKLIDYSKVPSQAMHRYRFSFKKHDESGFNDFIQKLVSGDKDVKVNAETLYPHQVLNFKTFQTDDKSQKQLLIKTWDSLPNYFTKPVNALPVIDVSGSMTIPLPKSTSLMCMDAAISLGLYMAQKNESGFKNVFCTFSSEPEIVKLNDKLDIFENYKLIRKANWGMNTDIQSTFKAIAKFGVEHKLGQEDMPEYLVIFSDMNFDVATGRKNIGVQKMGEKIFSKHGYKTPIIVYWNLNHNGSFTVKADKEGTILISGFSPSAIKDIFASMSDLDSLLEKISPVNIMLSALENYQDVKEAVEKVLV